MLYAMKSKKKVNYYIKLTFLDPASYFNSCTFRGLRLGLLEWTIATAIEKHCREDSFG